MPHVRTNPGYSDGDWWVHYLTIDGSRTGSRDMTVDGSVTPVVFYVDIPEKHTWYGASLMGMMTSAAKFDSGGFGSGPVLTNGFRNVYRATPESPWLDVLDDPPWYSNADLVGWSHRTDIHTWGQGDEIMKWIYDTRFDQAPFTLTEGMGYGHIVQDDLTALATLQVRITGPMLNNMYRG